MILFIDITELEEEFSSCPISLNYVRDVGIDYWTNTIDGIYCEPYSKDERDCCLFRFEKFDFKLTNRWHNYVLSYGEAGITINFVSTKS